MDTKASIIILLLLHFCDIIENKSIKDVKFNNIRKKLYELGDNPDYEVVFLNDYNENKNESEKEVLFKIEVFGRVLDLKLIENNNLISQNFKSYIKDGNNSFLLPPLNKSCLLMSNKNEISASIFYCKSKFISGFIFLDDITLEISPISYEILTETIPHLIRKHPHFNSNKFKQFQQSALTNEMAETFTLEVSIFFDEFAYNIFAPYLSYDDEKIRDMLLAYLNGVQALYHHPSLKGYVDIVIVRLDILKTQPKNLPIYNGESGLLLKSFCSYQQELNEEDDSNPNHWDMGLYISGLDFFTYDGKGYKDYGIMGLSTVGGVCYGKFSCVIAEFGSTDAFGNPYPTAGFGSVYVLAHEIGHNLGMHHDGTKNNCLPNGFIMSASRGTSGETHWSSCSAEVMEKLKKKNCLRDAGSTTFDHSKFFEKPGRIYSPKKQCELFLSDEKSYPIEDQSEICQTLKCTIPGRTEIYFSGPPLDGTKCDEDKQCYAGECIKSTNNYSNIKSKIWNIKDQMKKKKSKICDDTNNICLLNRENEIESDQNEIIGKELIPFSNPTKKYSYNEEYLIDYLLLPN